MRNRSTLPVRSVSPTNAVLSTKAVPFYSAVLITSAVLFSSVACASEEVRCGSGGDDAASTVSKFLFAARDVDNDTGLAGFACAFFPDGTSSEFIDAQLRKYQAFALASESISVAAIPVELGNDLVETTASTVGFKTFQLQRKTSGFWFFKNQKYFIKFEDQ